MAAPFPPSPKTRQEMSDQLVTQRVTNLKETEKRQVRSQSAIAKSARYNNAD